MMIIIHFAGASTYTVSNQLSQSKCTVAHGSMVVINRSENDSTSILSKGNIMKRTNLSNAIN